MTYFLLVGALLAIALVIRALGEFVARRRGDRIPLLPTLLATSVLVVLTIVFDNAMIAAGLFAYSDAHISGIRIGFAPLEDLAYPIAVAVMAPGLWELVGGRRIDAAT